MKHLSAVDQLKNEFGIKDLSEVEKEEFEIFETFRHGLESPDPKLECDNLDKYKKANYRFIVKPQSFDKSQFSGSETIAKNFKDVNRSYQFLGYNLQ